MDSRLRLYPQRYHAIFSFFGGCQRRCYEIVMLIGTSDDDAYCLDDVNANSYGDGNVR